MMTGTTRRINNNSNLVY